MHVTGGAGAIEFVCLVFLESEREHVTQSEVLNVGDGVGVRT